MNALVRSFAGRKPAWWGLGVQNPDGWNSDTPVTDGMIQINAIVPYELLPIHITLNGMQIELPDHRALYRHDDGLGEKSAIGSNDQETVSSTVPNILQIVSKDYQIVQPDVFASSLDPVGRVLPVQTLGVLDKGSRYWVCFAGDDYEFQGAEFNEYLIASDDHKGGALRIYRTDVEVVCQNTWNLSLASARSLITIPHTGNPAERLNYLAKLQVARAQSRNELLDQFAALANFKLNNPDDVAEIIEAAYPDPKKSGRLLDFEESQNRAHQYLDLADEVVMSVAEGAAKDMEKYEGQVRRIAGSRVSAAEMYAKYNDTRLPQHAGTAFNLVGAIVEARDFGGVTRAATAESVLFGDRARDKANAMSTALRLAGYKNHSKVENVN